MFHQTFLRYWDGFYGALMYVIDLLKFAVSTIKQKRNRRREERIAGTKRRVFNYFSGKTWIALSFRLAILTKNIIFTYMYTQT